MALISVKADESLVTALREAARRNLSSVSVEVRQAVQRHLQEQGINWRDHGWANRQDCQNESGVHR